MTQTILEQMWKLRSDPFFPAVDAAGQKLLAEAFQRSLNPLLDVRVLPLYFDIYDWEFSGLARGISPTAGLSSFPDPAIQPADGAFMFLLSGRRESGRDSLANLILMKIRDITGSDPLIVEAELEGREKAKNVATVAKQLLDTLRIEAGPHTMLESALLRMEATWGREYKQQWNNPNADYSDAFQSFRNQLRGVLLRPLVLKINRGGDNDSWLRIYNAVRNICSHVIVMTADVAYARTAYNSMSTRSENIAWIQAGLLDSTKAQQFLLHRLTTVRMSGANLPVARPLLPFLAEALDTLYQRGSGEAAGGKLEYPVGWLRRMLYRALKDRLDALAGTDPAALDIENTLIGPDDILRAAKVIQRM
jgi:hypothetical protein